MRMSKFFILFLGTIILLSGCETVKNDKLNIFNESQKEVRMNLKIPQTDFLIGNKEAKNEVVLFIDFDCQACHSLFDNSFKTINEYVNNNDAKVYIYHLAYVDKFSTVKAVIAEFMKDKYPQDYPKAVEKLASINNKVDLTQEENIKSFFQMNFPDVNYIDVQNNIVNNNQRYLTKVKENMNIAKKFDVKYTPTIVINGTKIKNPFSGEEIKKEMR